MSCKRARTRELCSATERLPREQKTAQRRRNCLETHRTMLSDRLYRDPENYSQRQTVQRPIELCSATDCTETQRTMLSDRRTHEIQRTWLSDGDCSVTERTSLSDNNCTLSGGDCSETQRTTLSDNNCTFERWRLPRHFVVQSLARMA